MKKLLRLLALILAVTMAISMFAACGDGDNKKDDTSDDQSNQTENAEDQDNIVDNSHPSLTIDGKEIDISDNPVMFTVGGIDVRFDEFRYMLKYFESYYGIDRTMWEGNPENFPYFVDEVGNALIENNFGYIVGKLNGITLTDEDLAEVDAYIEDEIAQFDSRQDFEDALAGSGITEELLRHVIEESVMCERVYLDLFGGENPTMLPSDEEIRQELINNYVRVQHLLIANDHFMYDEGYEDYTEEELTAAAKELVTAKLQEIKNGEATIYDLAQEIGDDPGMYDNERGYFFTYGAMVEPFEEASFALQPGELSDIVETSYGFHIILRLDQEEYINSNFENVKEEYVGALFNDYIDSVLADAEIVLSDYYEKLTYDSIT